MQTQSSSTAQTCFRLRKIVRRYERIPPIVYGTTVTKRSREKGRNLISRVCKIIATVIGAKHTGTKSCLLIRL